MVTAAIFNGCGLQVVYGDTDSCFVTQRGTYEGGAKRRCEVALTVLSEVLSYTPMSKMKMEVEGVHRRVLLVKKKNYVCSSFDGKIKFKGVSVVRGDSLGICRYASSSALSSMLLSPSRDECRAYLADLLSDTLGRCATGSLTLEEVSKTTKIDGVNCYVYVSRDGVVTPLPMETHGPGFKVDYSMAEVVRRLRSDFERYTIAGGYGSIGEVMQHNSLRSVLACP